MAGMLGIPIGTIGTRPGATDFSPYLAMRRMQIQAEEQAAAQAQQQGQFDASMGQRQQEFASSQEQAKAEMEFKQREAERAKSRYELEFLNREEQQKQQSEMQKAEMDLRVKDQESLAKSREDRNVQDKTEFEAKQAGEAAAKAEEENLSDLYSQARSIVAQRAPAIDLTGQMPPEAVRDALLAELDQVDVSGQEKIAMQKAVDDWYKAAVQKKKDDLAAQREERMAQNEKADIEIKQRQIESYDNAKKMERAQRASAPFRKQQEAIVKQTMDLNTKLALIEGQLEGAPPERKPFYQNAKQGLVMALANLKAMYDKLEAQASAKEAEVLAGS